MKFSWQSLNYLIDLEKISFEDLKSKLILNGFEIDNINIQSEPKDFILEIDITSNRIDTTTNIGMAQEIGSIFNLPMKFIMLNPCDYISKSTDEINSINQSNKPISLIRLNKLTNLQQPITPQWLINYINLHEISLLDNNLLTCIKHYIKIKWGHQIYFINTSEIKLEKNLKTLINRMNFHNTNLLNLSTNSRTIALNKNDKEVLFIMPIYKYTDVKDNYFYNFINAYNDTINLLSTYIKCTISKIYEYNYNINYKSIDIDLNKQYILNILGPNQIYPNKFLTKQQILNILQQLNLQPQYNYKKFHITIPHYRIKDLTREVDIIEEIARIYGFEGFLDKIPQFNKKGRITKTRFFIKHIRNTLHHLGLNEVVNSSLEDNEQKFKQSITLYNPMTEEQSQIRNNLLHGLIKNYIYNNNQKNNTLELFEIGKIIYQKNNKVFENLHISSILYNENYIRLDWAKKTKNISWFHAKGKVETFLTQLQANIEWKKIKDISNDYLLSLSYLFNMKKTIGIYKYNSDTLIGIFGQLNILNNINISKNCSTYIFDININQLINTINRKTHLEYIIKPYSSYPSVIRDISININNKYNINDIKYYLLTHSKNLLESIEIISYYQEKKSKKNFLCLRITYRSLKKTLNNIDIKKIDNDLESLLTSYI